MYAADVNFALFRKFVESHQGNNQDKLTKEVVDEFIKVASNVTDSLALGQ